MYPHTNSSGHELAADAIHAASQEHAPLVRNWDFDLGGPLFDDGSSFCIDKGNVETAMADGVGNRASIEEQTREILALEAVPIMIGGNCSVPIPFFVAFAEHGPIWILQINAHIDWHEDLDGERYDFSSPMRRASEIPHVAWIVQVGIRSVGSAGAADVESAAIFQA
ncbi:arginase family protein [Aureimonas altamirensis]|uniref:arginase family protein n=1 Tax=Aureimonas altamirensis TaxID=370622 RepID=UPI0030B9CC38